jgi:hypothetical protein
MDRRAGIDEQLAAVPLFAGLSKKQLRRISSLITRIDLPAGQVLTLEGQSGSEFFVVLEGEVEVRQGDRVIATRRPGEYVGEIALLDRRPRTATVVATTPVSVEVLPARVREPAKGSAGAVRADPGDDRPAAGRSRRARNELTGGHDAGRGRCASVGDGHVPVHGPGEFQPVWEEHPEAKKAALASHDALLDARRDARHRSTVSPNTDEADRQAHPELRCRSIGRHGHWRLMAA